jgi:hypothetical protein
MCIVYNTTDDGFVIYYNTRSVCRVLRIVWNRTQQSSTKGTFFTTTAQDANVPPCGPSLLYPLVDEREQERLVVPLQVCERSLSASGNSRRPRARHAHTSYRALTSSHADRSWTKTRVRAPLGRIAFSWDSLLRAPNTGQTTWPWPLTEEKVR